MYAVYEVLKGLEDSRSHAIKTIKGEYSNIITLKSKYEHGKVAFLVHESDS